MTKRGTLWPIAIVTVLAITVAANFAVYYVANHDSSLAIEPDYYRKAVGWDSTMAQARENRSLGWRLTPSLAAFTARDGAELRVALTDSAGAAIPGAIITVVAFYNARAGDLVGATLAPDGSGYGARIPVHHGGVWELRFDVARGRDRFTSTSRVEAVPAAGT